MTTLALFLILFFAMLIGVPVAISLGLASIITILLFSNDSLASIALKMIEATSTHYSLLAIPFFIFSSAFLSQGGIAKRMVAFAIACLGHVRGGLAMASVLACMLFAAVSGSSPATVAAIGPIVIGGMIAQGYSKKFAAGVICNAGSLGILIPPSIPMLVYAAATEQSATEMFMAGFMPGLMVGAMLMLVIYVTARVRNFPVKPFEGVGSIWHSFLKAAGGLFLIILVLGTIYGGIASPTEAAAVSALYAFVASVFGYREIGPLKNVAWRRQDESAIFVLFRNLRLTAVGMFQCVNDPEIRHTIMESVKTSGMLLFVIANAFLFAHVLTTERIPHGIADWVVHQNLHPWVFLLVVNLLLLAAGNFMEPTAIILIMAPILFPIAVQLGVDPVHLGIIMVVNMEIGMMTPPVGLNLFVTAGITGEKLGWAVRAALPWLVVLIVALLLITYIPIISLWLPNTLY